MIGDIIQPTHLMFILVVALIVLGPKRLPEVGRSLGRGMRDFRQGISGVQSEARDMFKDTFEESGSESTLDSESEPEFESDPVPAPHFVVSPTPDAESTPVRSPHFVVSPAAATDPAPVRTPHLVVSPTTDAPAPAVAVASEPQPVNSAD